MSSGSRMFSIMVVENQTRAYIRAIPGLPIARQREMAADVGAHATYEWGEAGKQMDIRSAWLRSLRPGDVAWLPSVLCLIVPPDSRPERYRPTSDLGAVLADLCARGVIIEDAKAKVSTRDPTKWGAHIRWAMDRASQGERSRAAMRRAAKKSQVERMPGTVARWLADGKAKDREAARRVWTSALFRSDQEAADALPPELSGLSGSTLRRILGPRRPGDPRAGGRGKKRKSR